MGDKGRPVLDQYLDELQSEGDFDSEGRFTLVSAQAREKLAAHRFAARLEGLLAILSACMLGECSWIEVDNRHLSWNFSFDTLLPEWDEFCGLLERIFTPEQPLWLREMALALNSLYPKHCQSLTWKLPNGWVGQFLPEGWQCQKLASQPFHSIELKLPSGWMARLTSFFQSRKEQKILRWRTRWSPVPVRFPQQSSYQMDPPRVPSGAVALFHVESEHPGLGLAPYADPPSIFQWRRSTEARTSVRAALLPGSGKSQVWIHFRGLLFARHSFTSKGFCVEAVLNTDSLDLDASRAHIVNNQRLNQRLAALTNWVLEGLAVWLTQGSAQIEQRALCLNLLQTRRHTQKLGTILKQLSLFQLADGTPCSFQLLQESMGRSRILYWAKQGPAKLHGLPILAHSQLADVAFLKANFRSADEFCDLSWSAQPRPSLAWQKSLELPDGQALLGLVDDPSHPGEVRLFLRGQPFFCQPHGLLPERPVYVEVDIHPSGDEPWHKLKRRLLKETQYLIEQELALRPF